MLLCIICYFHCFVLLGRCDNGSELWKATCEVEDRRSSQDISKGGGCLGLASNALFEITNNRVEMRVNDIW